MFLRSTVKKGKDGKTYRYWKLVENYRTERGVRQRVVAHLGDLARFTAEEWQALAEKMGQPEMARVLEARAREPRRGRPRQTLLDLEAPPQPDSVSIRLSTVERRKGRQKGNFGDVYAGLVMWKRLGLGALLAELLGESDQAASVPGRRREVPDSLIAALIAVNRLVAPTSEWGIRKWWVDTALPQILGIPVAKVTDYRLYHCLDRVYAHKEAIERHLAERGKGLLGRDYTFLLYDLTSTYFEGQAKRNPKATYGYSRDRRSDAKQVCVGYILDEAGWGLGMETWRGNIKDYETLTAALDQLEDRCGSPRDPDNPDRPRHVVCMDRGMTTEDTIPELRRRGYGYVLGERRSEVRKHWAEIDHAAWEVIRRERTTQQPLVEVQEIHRQGGDRLIAVRSAGARQKERGIHERFLGRLKGDLERLALRVSKGQLKDAVKIERQVGRLQERYPGVSGWVTVELVAGEQGQQRLEWSVKPEAEEAARAFEGVYLLRTNVEGTSARQVWEQYIHLIRIEQGIRTLKDVLKLRPVFHHKELRVEAHLFFTFLAYELLWALEWQHRSRGGELTGPRILEVLHQITLGTIAMTTTEGQPLRLERVDVPTREEAEVLATLGIRLPRPRVRLEAMQLALETGS